MRHLDQYTIRFINLNLGRHEYDFQVGDDFFEHFENSLIDQAEANIHCVLNKEKDTFFTLDLTIKGHMQLNCDRCLDELKWRLEEEHHLIVKLEDEQKEPEANVIILPPDAIEINIAKPIYDFLNLAKPMKPVCEEIEKNCNQEMIKLINNLGKERKDDDDIDPRWEKLRNLYN